MEKVRIERTILVLMAVASLGLSAVSIKEGWEFWMPPVILVMLVGLWIVHFLCPRTAGLALKMKNRLGLFK